MMGEVTPLIGKKYLLYLGGENSVKGFYIGINPVKTPWYFRINLPEGHTFLRSRGDEMELYCTRDNDLKEVWLTEGDEGPEWHVGIPVTSVKAMLSKREEEYLKEKLNKWEKK